MLGVKDVKWDKGGTVRAGDYIFFMEKQKKIINWERDFLYTAEIVSAVNSDRMSYIVLRGRWCIIVVLNVHASSEEKIDDSKDSVIKN